MDIIARNDEQAGDPEDDEGDVRRLDPQIGCAKKTLISGKPHSSALHQRYQLFDMLDRRRLLDPMAEIEDVGTVGECVKDATRRKVQRLAAGNQRQRVEIALNWK